MYVLIADDDPVYRALLEELLTAWKFDVTSASDGNEAWEAIQSNDQIKLAILDWMMPGMDGFQLCRRIKEGKTKVIYIILITGSRMKNEMMKVIVAGADDYIMKPFEATDLKIRLRNALRIINLEEELARMRSAPAGGSDPAATASVSKDHSETQQGGGAALAPFDVDALLARCGNSQEFLQTILVKFQETAAKDLREMEQSIRASDRQKLAFLAHSLKGAAANLSATALQQAAGGMEKIARNEMMPRAEKALKLLEKELKNCIDWIKQSSALKAGTAWCAPADRGSVEDDDTGRR